MKKSTRKRNMQSITVMMFVITLLIWVALLFVKAFIWDLSFKALLEDIISNILGILPPMLIFNFIYEYLTKDHIADEMSEQITKTLIGTPEAIEVFENEDKVRFIKSTIQSIVGEQSAEMVNAVVEPYITSRYNTRSFFKYTIILRDYNNNTMFDSSKYMKVYENLKFKKNYIEKNTLPSEFSIAFIVKDHELDAALRNHKFIFQENLSIDPEEMTKLLNFSEEEGELFIKNEMQLKVFIDDQVCQLSGVFYSENAIVIAFESSHDNSFDNHGIEISFAMPQRKGHSEFLVSISEPTYSPMIQLSYPEETMNVKAFSFMNDGDDSSLEQATHNIGNYEFCVQDKWIYPMSGVVFVIDDK